MVKMKDGEPSDPCPASLAPSDCSFVLLENPSLLEAGSGHVHQSVSFPSVVELPVSKQQHNGQLASSMVELMLSSVSPEELHRRLQEVLQENLELKEMLSQNNLAMKNQLATLLAWQTQVKAVFQQHGEKFTETSALIHKLRAENVLLKNIIEEQKSKITAGTEGSKLEELLMVENAELKQTVEELKRNMSEMRQRATSTSRESPSSKEVELMSLLKQVNERLEVVERSRRQMSVDLEHVNAQRAKMERDVTQLKTQLAEEKHNNASLKEQMSVMSASKQAQPAAIDEQWSAQMSELQALCERLSSDKEELIQELESLQSSLRSNEQQRAAYVEVQSQGFQEKLDRLTAQLVEQEEALARKDAEIRKMQETTRKLQLENEGLAILKAQVDVYQSDFNAEREGRERLAGEREQLLEEISLLRRANQELKELTATRRAIPSLSPSSGNAGAGSGWYTIAAPNRRQEQARQPSPARHDSPTPKTYEEEVPPPRRYVCPICDQVFQLLDHLEHHVDTCIN